MLELHRSQIGAHGRLTSSNCVIDNRWVCKITDYGLDKFKANAKEDISEYQQYRSTFISLRFAHYHSSPMSPFFNVTVPNFLFSSSLDLFTVNGQFDRHISYA